MEPFGFELPKHYELFQDQLPIIPDGFD